MGNDLTDREKMLLKATARREGIRRGTATTSIVLNFGIGITLLLMSIPPHSLVLVFRLIGLMLITAGIAGLVGRRSGR
jgi:hypothetical protein